MKKLILFLLFGIVAGSFTACSDENYSSRLKELIIEDMTFDQSQSTKTLTFRHEDLSNYECKSSEDWCAAAFDFANSKLTISVKANETYDPRTATITLADKVDGTLRAFTVNQTRNTGLFIDETLFNISMYGGSATVELESNVEYDVVIPSDCDWVSRAEEPAKTRGLEKSSFTLNVSENKTYKERKALITVINKEENLSGTVTIIQPFETIFKADNTSFNLDMDGGIITVNMESNIDYKVVIPKEFNWISIPETSKTRETKTSAVTLKIDENMSYGDRDGIVYICNEDAGEEIKVIIHQTFAAVLKADNNTFEVAMEGGTVTINMESNISYDVIIPEDCKWVTRSSAKTRAAKPSIVTLSVAENKSYKERTVIVNICNKQAGVSVPITIHQPFNTVFKADKTDFDVDMAGGPVTINMESNISYDVTIPSDCDWITLPASVRKAGTTRATSTSVVTLRVKENTTYLNREAVVTIGNKEAGTEIKISIHQPFNIAFKADKTAFDVEAAGETVTINMESNISYDVSIPSGCDWIILPTSTRKKGITRATNNSTVILRVKENTNLNDRDAVVTIGNKDAEKNTAYKPIKIFVHQKALTPSLTVDKTDIEVPTEGGSASVKVESNVDFVVTIPPGCDWIKQSNSSRTRAAKTSIVTFTVSANTSEQDRTATVTISNKNAGVSATVNISQKFSTVFNVDESPIEIDELGGTREITVAANVDVIVLPQVDWLTVGEKKAGGKGYWTQQIIVSALKNKVAKREGAVKFLHAPTNQSFIVKVTQNRLLYITEQEITLTEGDGPQKPTLNNPNAMEVTWSSSNIEVATVNSTGMVTAVKAGTAEITVTSADKKYTDKVKVTVNKKEAEE